MKHNFEQINEAPRLIYYPELKRLTGLSRSTVWKLEKEGNFPKRRLITSNRVAWIEGEVHSWITSRSTVGASNLRTRHNLPQNRLATPESTAATSGGSDRFNRRPSYLRDDY